MSPATAAPARATQLALLDRALAAFEEAQAHHDHSGADDSEPSAKFHALLVRAACGKPVGLPLDPHDWSLFGDGPVAQAAAARLRDAAEVALAVVRTTAHADWARVVARLKDYCWRSGWPQDPPIEPPPPHSPGQRLGDRALVARFAAEGREPGGGKYPTPLALELALRPGEPWFAVRAQDVLAPGCLNAYAVALHAQGLVRQAEDVVALAARMRAWQAQNPDLVKVPD